MSLLIAYVVYYVCTMIYNVVTRIAYYVVVETKYIWLW